jgi:hypothetical protein
MDEIEIISSTALLIGIWGAAFSLSFLLLVFAPAHAQATPAAPWLQKATTLSSEG